MVNADNEEYVGLRNQAIREGDLMVRFSVFEKGREGADAVLQGKCFSQSKEAYNSGDGAKAKSLSLEGKDHQRRKNEFNGKAAQWIYNGSSRSSFRP